MSSRLINELSMIRLGLERLHHETCMVPKCVTCASGSLTTNGGRDGFMRVLLCKVSIHAVGV
jgi:hypothetical protein